MHQNGLLVEYSSANFQLVSLSLSLPLEFCSLSLFLPLEFCSLVARLKRAPTEPRTSEHRLKKFWKPQRKSIESDARLILDASNPINYRELRLIRIKLISHSAAHTSIDMNGSLEILWLLVQQEEKQCNTMAARGLSASNLCPERVRRSHLVIVKLFSITVSLFLSRSLSLFLSLVLY